MTVIRATLVAAIAAAAGLGFATPSAHAFDALALLQDHVGFPGAELLQMVGRIDAGEARADDQ